MLGILLAAGKGTRMKNPLPKVLFDINDEPLCFAPFKALFQSCEKVIVVLGYRGPEVKEAILARASEVFGSDAVHAKVSFYTQEEQRGTGDAVRVAIDGFGKAVSAYDYTLVLNGDLPLAHESWVRNFSEQCRSENLDAACLSFVTEKPQGFGRIIRDAQKNFKGIREEKDASSSEKLIQEVNGGVYLFKTSTVVEKIHGLKTDNKQGEFYLTDLLGADKNPQSKTSAILSHDAEALLGVNTTFELTEVRSIAQRRLQRELCETYGLDILCAESVWISARTKFEGPVRIGLGTQIRGRSTIEKDVVIDGNVLVQDSVLREGAHILWGSVINSSQVGARAQVGPMAHLRPGSDLGEQVKIGNFVEIKKSKFEKGSKASHLSYVGDAHVGEESNIGAGTITCNYDGFLKHKTIIGKRAFIGSDTQLVAPVSIGDEAYVGSGTTVTEDVPSGALAISRPDMVVKEGYARKLAAKRAAQKKD